MSPNKSLRDLRELHAFFSTYFSDSDPESDEEVTRSFAEAASPEKRQQVLLEARALLSEAEFPLEELGVEANRWFADPEEARSWLKRITEVMERAGDGESAGGTVVKDSNGTALSEGDSVTVIKDLKVKGGSSDLKRGTVIRKIHLVDDPDVIECRVDGSTLVLKTCFLKKA